MGNRGWDIKGNTGGNVNLLDVMCVTGQVAYYCHKRHLESWPQRGESRVVHDAGVGTEEKLSGGSKEDIFNLGMGDKFVQNELLCRN